MGIQILILSLMTVMRQLVIAVTVCTIPQGSTVNAALQVSMEMPSWLKIAQYATATNVVLIHVMNYQEDVDVSQELLEHCVITARMAIMGLTAAKAARAVSVA